MSWVDVVGWLGAILLFTSRWLVEVMRSRQVYVVAMLLIVVYAAQLRAWPLVAVGILLLVTKLWEMWRLTRLHQEPETGFSVIEVGPQDEYLRHMLRVHGKDILEHQPGFVWDGAAPGARAALVQRGPETVGVILGHLTAADVVQLDLDYVTPRFRNSGPGRFVFFDSGFFASIGVRTVFTPPQMRHAYYSKLGFEPSGDRYVHHVA